MTFQTNPINSLIRPLLQFVVLVVVMVLLVALVLFMLLVLLFSSVLGVAIISLLLP